MIAQLIQDGERHIAPLQPREVKSSRNDSVQWTLTFRSELASHTSLFNPTLVIIDYGKSQHDVHSVPLEEEGATRNGCCW